MTNTEIKNLITSATTKEDLQPLSDDIEAIKKKLATRQRIYKAVEMKLEAEEEIEKAKKYPL